MIELILLDGSSLDVPLVNPGCVLAPEELKNYEKLRSDSRRREFLLGRMLLKAALTEDPFHARNFRMISPTLSAMGKPAITGAEFNLSHDADVVLLAIGDQTVGVDIESVQNFDDAMMALCFTGDECKRISQSLHPDRVATIIWCMKEAAAKAAGFGLLSEIGKPRKPNLFFRGGFLNVGGFNRAYAVCSPLPMAPINISPALPRFSGIFNRQNPARSVASKVPAA